MFIIKPLLAVLFFIASLILAGEAKALDSKTVVLEKKTLTRAEDFVVVYGKTLRKSLGEDIGQLGLFAFHEGKLVPIPFQIDEINKEGEWVLTQVPPTQAGAGLKPERDDDDGNLDENDELAFMARDAGDRVPPEGYPPEALKVDEIMIRDPIDGGKSWVYLCFFKGSFAHSHRDYVAYVFPEDQIKTGNYVMGFPPELPIAPGMISIHGSPSILDRMKIRLKVKILGIEFSLAESNFISRLSLYKDGPIRVIRRTRSAIKFIGMFRSPSAAVENIFYENAVVIPIWIRLPYSTKAFKFLIPYIIVRGTADLKNMHGWKLKTNLDPRWLKIDGKMDEDENTLNGKEGFNWFLASGPPGVFMIRLVLDRNPDGTPQKTPITTRLYYKDDDASIDPPEATPGESPDVGYWLDGLRDLEKGLLYICPALFMIKDYSEGKEKDYLNILDRPLEVSVN
ncbi:MAG: hypothetical protein NT009_08785 [Proteobacteria bacterium]|nr:hypothetical protein [Pseudomonadota bacterium]